MNSLVVLACLLGATFGQYHGGYHHGGHLGGYEGGYGGQVAYHHGHDDHYEHHAPAHYAFEYSVHDPHTGDVKAQHETREGDVVKGYYTFKEADGTTREVHYTADHHNGFNAEVKRIGHAHHAPAHHAPAHHAPVHHAPIYQHY